ARLVPQLLGDLRPTQSALDTLRVHRREHARDVEVVRAAPTRQHGFSLGAHHLWGSGLGFRGLVLRPREQGHYSRRARRWRRATLAKHGQSSIPLGGEKILSQPMSPDVERWVRALNLT